MPKIGKIKASCTDLDTFSLTPEEVSELIEILETAKDSAEGATSEKCSGLVTLEIDDGRISVATTKVKTESEENDD